MKSEGIVIAGVDGCTDGWLAVIERQDDDFEVRKFPSFSRIVDDLDLQLIVIDIPIGLTERGPRLSDIEARRFIGPRGSSVFPAPLRPMLAAKDYPEACSTRFGIEHKRCSKQLWAITPKIREVDGCMNPDLQGRVYEGHPEVSFACMNGGCLNHSKHKAEGREQRVALLEKHFPDLRSRLVALSELKADGDIIDAFACLWTARRLSRGNARRFPLEPPLDARGLRMEINA
jgi:predicted RNase H-like nuclease